MNRRGFIRRALAATLGVAAGALLPNTPVEKVVKVFSEVPGAGSGVFTFHGIRFVEDPNCPEGHLYFLPSSLQESIVKGNARIIKGIQEFGNRIDPYV